MPVLGAGSYPGSVKRSEPTVFLTLRRIHGERSRQGPTKFPRVGTIVRRRQAVFAARQSGLFLVFQVPLTRHAERGLSKHPLKAALRQHSF